MTWILIFVVVLGGKMAAGTATFQDQAACNAAIPIVEALKPQHAGHLHNFWAACVPSQSETSK